MRWVTILLACGICAALPPTPCEAAAPDLQAAFLFEFLYPGRTWSPASEGFYGRDGVGPVIKATNKGDEWRFAAAGMKETRVVRVANGWFIRYAGGRTENATYNADGALQGVTEGGDSRTVREVDGQPRATLRSMHDNEVWDHFHSLWSKQSRPQGLSTGSNVSRLGSVPPRR